ncbi:MAG: hypothetical protein NTZ93_05110 [Candidatus Beckwithbacteria bacterium]|nr:hypothetical protein [Candidatus Beckwithbacteria bacterium]
MGELVSGLHGHERFVNVDWFQPEQLQGVINDLTAFGEGILWERNLTEGRVKVVFPGHDALASILIADPLDYPTPPRTPLRFRKSNSLVGAARQLGVDFGVSDKGIIVRSTKGSEELDMGGEFQCALDLSECLFHYPAIVMVEAKRDEYLRDGRTKPHWEPLLPNGKKVLTESLLSGAAGLLK